MFNVENILAVIATSLAMGFSLNEAAKKSSALKPILGRMQGFGGNGLPPVFVDYAHTPDGLAQALMALRQHQHASILLVFGCGGDRDQGKRKQMGYIACQQADRVILTDDNPRYEASKMIIDAILLGCDANKVQVIPNRTEAIKTAILQASKDDCILIAGKGHETYQELQGIQHPFSDQTIVSEVLSQWKQQ
jgi:UDP-N-acetylmuramoyl-L-alanyl-D-glutamate--2,6-diaminopimelate ligase